MTAVGNDGQHSAESSAWVRTGRPPPWMIAALALLAVALATIGLLVWAPWQPDGPPPPVTSTSPVPPAGLTGEVLPDTTIELQWEPAPADSAAVAEWEIRRDGEVVDHATETQTTVPHDGFHSYTVVAVGEDGQRSRESENWNSPPAWQNLEDTGFQETFDAAGVAEHNGELWVVGGGHGTRNDVRVLDPQTGEWRDGPKLPMAISHAALVSTGQWIYLLGGITATKDDIGVPLATVYRLDPEDPNGTWIEDVPLPAPRYSGAAAWDGQRLVFAGGAEQFEPRTPRLSAADIWELRSGNWEPVGQLTQAREHLAAVTNEEGTIWFVGGADVGSNSVFANVDVFSSDTASSSTAISTAVSGAAAAWTSATGVCVFGGSTVVPNQISEPVDEVECLDGPDPGWPDLPEPRYNAGAVVIDSTVYVVGGGSAPENTVLALRFG